MSPPFLLLCLLVWPCSQPRAAGAGAPKKSNIPWDHTSTASYRHTTCLYILLPTSHATGKLVSLRLRQPEGLCSQSAAVEKSRWCNKDDIVTISCGCKAFLVSRNSSLSTWFGAAKGDPWAKRPQASTWLMPGWDLKAMQCRTSLPSNALLKQQCFQGQH